MSRLLSFLACVAMLACGGETQAPRPSGEIVTARHDEDAAVVAEVNGVAITDAQVKVQAEHMGTSPREALDELVALELLAQAAHERGFADDPAVRTAYKQAMVRALLENDFETTMGRPEHVPGSYVDRAWDNRTVKIMFNHAQFNEVAYVRIAAAKDDPPDEVARKKQAAAELRRRLVAARPADHLEFQQQARAIGDELGVQVLVSGEKLLSVAPEGTHVEEFAEAAHRLKKRGDISHVVKTAWGFDILFFQDFLPAESHTKEEAAPKIRERLFETVQRAEFQKYAGELGKGRSIEVRPEVLGEADMGVPRP